MDSRLTLGVNDTFLESLYTAYRLSEKIHLLIDDNGITRAEGIVKKISVDIPTPFIELENNIKINLESIVALNGVFRPEYGEC